MRLSRMLMVTCSAIAILAVSASTVRAADPRAEVGVSMVGLTFLTPEDEDTVTMFGIPSEGFGVFTPTVYASFYLTPNVALEPQLGFTSFSQGEDDSFHLLNVSGQVDYLLRGTSRNSAYLFASVGVLDASDEDTNPKTASIGAGLRLPAGDRLAFRISGRWVHYTEGLGNGVSFGVSIGGNFGQR